MEATATLPAAYRMTYADWLALPQKEGLCEIIEGDLYMTPAPSTRHQRICKRLLLELVRTVEPDFGEVFMAPFGVKLSDDNVVEPDVLVVLTPNLHRVKEQVIDGPPDLVVETLSPGSARRDMTHKRAIYQKHGVQEYWIVDALADTVEVLTLKSGRYIQARLCRGDDTLTSPLLPDLSVPLPTIFERPA